MKRNWFMFVMIMSWIATGIIAFAFSSNTCQVCGQEVVSDKWDVTPDAITSSVSQYKKGTAGYTALDSKLFQEELRNVYARLEGEGVDSSKLFNGKKFPIYLSDVSFGSNVAFSIFYGAGDSRNGIIFGGKQSSEPTSSSIKQSIAHELGHMTDYTYFTDADRAKYRELRNISNDWNNDMEWEKRPNEMFAEDFAHAFGDTTYYHNKTALTEMTSDQRQKFKELVVKAIQAKQGEISLPSKPQKDLWTLKQAGIIPAGDFLLCEVSSYEQDVITNKELINWLFQVISREHPRPTFMDISKWSRVYTGVNSLNMDKKTDLQDLSLILSKFTLLLNQPDSGVMDASNKEITKGVAASIVVNYMQNVKNN